MDWIEEFIIKRNANVSNVFLFETNDPKRLHQFIDFARDGFASAVREQVVSVYHFILQTQELIDVDANRPVQLDPMTPVFSQLLSMLRGGTVLLVVSDVFRQNHADFLADFLAVASHDRMMYSKGSTVAVFTTNIQLFPRDLLNKVYSISVIPSTWKERETIITEKVRKIKEKTGLNIDVTEDVIQASSGLTLHEVETATLESLFRYQALKVEAYTEYKIKILRDLGLEYIEPRYGFEAVGGYDYLKDYLKNRVIKILRNPDIAKYYGLPTPRGALMYGMWGCGKTYLAMAMAKESGLPMVTLNPSDLFRGIVGETEARIRKIRNILESMAPIILFIDEFDQLTMRRDMVYAGDSGVTRRLTNMLLQWFGDKSRKIYIIGATNFVDHVDPAFLRSGRLDEVIPVLLPDYKARKQIFKVHTKVIRKMPINGKVDYDELARLTKFFTGAEIEKVCIEAGALAMEKGREHVTRDEFIEAIENIQLNTDTRLRYVENMIQQLNKLENVNKSFVRKALEIWRENEVEEVADRLDKVIQRMVM